MSTLPYSITTVTGSTATCVSVQEIKEHAYVDTTLQDALVQRQLNAASRLIEIQSRRQLMQATFDVFYPYWPCDGKLPLPRFPVGSVTYVKYYDQNNTLQTLPSTDYQVVTQTDGIGYVEKLPNRTWPSAINRSNAVVARFTAGSTSTADVPDTLKQGICLTCADWFRERQNSVPGAMTELPIGVKALIAAEFPGTYP